MQGFAPSLTHHFAALETRRGAVGYAPVMPSNLASNPPDAWLVFGLSGTLGLAFGRALDAADPPVVAVSRAAQPPQPGVSWRQAALPGFPDPPEPIAAIASLGPLDQFTQWFAQSHVAPTRIVAIGSTSLHGKRHSPDPAERALSAALAESEATLAALAQARGCALTLLRPTLVYGNGRDRTLSRLVLLARRWRWLPLPRRAGGLRQPVHVDDIAAAVLGALRAPVPRPGHFDLPGGEVLPFDEMVRRSLAVGAPGARLLRLPGPVFRAGVGLMRGLGRLEAAGDGVLGRLDRDLVYDDGPARIALGHCPRGFQPSREAFPD